MHGDAAVFEHIAAVGDIEREDDVLLNQQHGGAVPGDCLDDLPDTVDNVGGEADRRTMPLETRTRPESAPNKVDFPAPLAPIRATSSPGASSRSTSKRTGVIP